MKIYLLSNSARILAERYEFHSSEIVERAMIDTSRGVISFLCSKSEFEVKLKDDDAVIVGDCAYYSDGSNLPI